MESFLPLTVRASLAEIGFWGKFSFSRLPKNNFCKYLLMFT